MNAKIVAGLASVAVLAFVGFAQGSNPSDPDYSQKEQRLVERLGEPGPANISARRSKRGPRGPRGFQGPRGAQGAAGVPGVIGEVGSFASAPVFLCGFFSGACSVGSTEIICPPGTQILSGGYSGVGIRAFINAPGPNHGWVVGAANEDEEPTSFRAYVLCGR